VVVLPSDSLTIMFVSVKSSSSTETVDQVTACPDPRDPAARSDSQAGDEHTDVSYEQNIEKGDERSGYFCLLDHHAADTSAFDSQDSDSEVDSDPQDARYTSDVADDAGQDTLADLISVADQLLKSMEADYLRVCAVSIPQTNSQPETPTAPNGFALAPDESHVSDPEDAQTGALLLPPASTDNQEQTKLNGSASALAEPMSEAKVQRIKQLMSSMSIAAPVIDSTSTNGNSNSSSNAPDWARDLSWQDGQLDQVMSQLVTVNARSRSKPPDRQAPAT
jgi:hypothetical protein